MKVCDRHNRTPATDEIHIKSSDTTVDLCSACVEQVQEFISNAKQESVEKPKRGWFKNSA